MILYFFSKEQEKRSILDLAAGLVMIAGGIILFVRSEPLTKYFPAVSAVLLGYGAVRMLIQAVKARMEPMKKFSAPADIRNCLTGCRNDRFHPSRFFA